MRVMGLVLVLLLTGCSWSVDKYQWIPRENQRDVQVCLSEANSAYVPLAAAPWAHKIRQTLYKDCMEKAGYALAVPPNQ